MMKIVRAVVTYECGCVDMWWRDRAADEEPRAYAMKQCREHRENCEKAEADLRAGRGVTLDALLAGLRE